MQARGVRPSDREGIRAMMSRPKLNRLTSQLQNASSALTNNAVEGEMR